MEKMRNDNILFGSIGDKMNIYIGVSDVSDFKKNTENKMVENAFADMLKKRKLLKLP